MAAFPRLREILGDTRNPVLQAFLSCSVGFAQRSQEEAVQSALRQEDSSD